MHGKEMGWERGAKARGRSRGPAGMRMFGTVFSVMCSVGTFVPVRDCGPHPTTWLAGRRTGLLLPNLEVLCLVGHY